MVTSSHEAMHRIFQHDAAAIAHAFTVLNLPFAKPIAVEQLSIDLTETAPVERRADTILDITTVNDRFLMVIEAQSAPDDSRPDSWSYYVTFLRNKYNLPVILVVICHDHVTARWAGAPMKIGHTFWTTITLYPLALGPHNVPAVTDPALVVQDLPLAALSAVTHAREADIGAILEAIVTGIRRIGGNETTEFYVELIEQGISHTAAAETWRNHMATDLSFFRSESAQKLRAQGRAEGVAMGRAEDVLMVLRHRGVVVTDAAADRIRGCQDEAQLATWLRRALDVSSVADLFGE
ncbi:hypothetical protein ACSVDM_24650 [Nocardia sp. JW2]|uniref:hypothetical protein n=1 Tax=Nocardia sp. JW2 TaxID=3450738 RepID=UPI003F42B1B1